MKRILFILSVFICVPITLVYAHPASQVGVSYNKEEKVLNVEIKHVSSNPRDHYIRLVYVSKNGEEPEKHIFVTQNPQGLTMTVPMEAEGGDVIQVKTFCSKKGIKEATLTIPEDDAEDEK